MDNSLIKRQAAIDALDKRFDSIPMEQTTEILLLRKDLRDLPSAQPEIVRCKECKYWMPHSQLGYDEDNETYHDYCGKLIPEDDYYAFSRDADDYCSRAERKNDEND